MEIAFYHLTKTDVESALPPLLNKVLTAGKRVVIRCADEARLQMLDAALWTKGKNFFLPHGTANDDVPPVRQPIFLTTEDVNPNQAEILLVSGDVQVAEDAAYERVLDMFDGQDEAALNAARKRWAHYKQEGCDLTYWQQQPSGGWEKKAV